MPSLLVVDDHPATRELLRAVFQYKGHRVIQAEDGPEALFLAISNRPDIVIADVVMPGMDGYRFVRELHSRPDCAAVPVVLVSASLHEDKARKLAEQCGAAAYVPKPFEPEDIVRTVDEVLALAQPLSTGKLDDSRFAREHEALLVDTLARKITELEKLNRDLDRQVAERTAELAQANENLWRQANRDVLTGLFNRRYLDDTLPRELYHCRRSGLPLALAMIDLDHFKSVNDRYGHDAGDQVLRSVCRAIECAMRSGDLACRYGGEEIVLVMPGASGEAAARRLEELRSRLSAAPACGCHPDLRVTFSAGVAVFPGNGSDACELLRAADAALYEAKKAGRDRVLCCES